MRSSDIINCEINSDELMKMFTLSGIVLLFLGMIFMFFLTFPLPLFVNSVKSFSAVYHTIICFLKITFSFTKRIHTRCHGSP